MKPHSLNLFTGEKRLTSPGGRGLPFRVPPSMNDRLEAPTSRRKCRVVGPMVLIGSLASALGACSSAPPALAPTALGSPAALATPPPAPDARHQATELFYSAKGHALGGDAECARIEFDAALERFRAAARPGDAEDLHFAQQLYESIQVYRSLLDGTPEEGERPPAEASADALIAPTPSATADELAAVGREVAASDLKTGFDIPIVVNQPVLEAIAFYQFRTPKAFAAALRRSGQFAPLMRGLLREQGLPGDLVYVAMIESAFKPNAHSRAAAHGFWQFIPGTARRYGLRQTRYLDERSDPIKSTLAAASYFRDLYEMFGDWHLAMAAYSTGEGRVLRALQRTGARDYWGLLAANQLHPETKAYVPFVTAAALISRDPARYGFDVRPDPSISFDVVSIGRPVDLARIAEAVGTDVEEMRLLNSELRTRSTPRDVVPYPVRVPAGAGPLLVASLETLPSAPEVDERKVKVRRGDTLAKVAARTGSSEAELSDLNDLPAHSRLKAGSLVLVPVKTKAPTSTSRSRGTRATLVAEAPPAQRANVRNRESGAVLALPTPAAAVTDASDLARRAGGAFRPLPPPPEPRRYEIPADGFERAVAPVKNASKKSSSPSRNPISNKPVSRTKYRVRRGDTLFRIASVHGTTVDTLRRQNGLSAGERLQVGSRLTIPSSASR